MESAALARDFIRKLGYASNADAIRMLMSGGIINAPITGHDVYRAQKIFGPDIASLKGKTRASPSAIVKLEHIPRPIAAEQSMHVDIMFVQSIPFLVSVTVPLGMTIAGKLKDGSRSTKALEVAILSQIAMYKGQGFTISTVLVDGEGGIAKCEQVLNGMGIQLSPAGPGQHVPVVERKIQVIKQAARAHLAVLPFRMPHSWLQWLVYFCCSRVNVRPGSSDSDGLSPREKFVGRKLDFHRDLRVGFGDYVQVHAQNIKKNSMAPRTVGAIALLPMGNLQGSVRFISLQSLRVITSDK